VAVDGVAVEDGDPLGARLGSNFVLAEAVSNGDALADGATEPVAIGETEATAPRNVPEAAGD